MNSNSNTHKKTTISYTLFESIKQNMPFSETEWAYFLNIPQDKFLNIKESKNAFFNIEHSQKIIKISEIVNLGKEVFQTTEKLKNWLDLPCYALGQHKPIDLLIDGTGEEKVTNELHKLYQDLNF